MRKEGRRNLKLWPEKAAEGIVKEEKQIVKYGHRSRSANKMRTSHENGGVGGLGAMTIAV